MLTVLYNLLARVGNREEVTFPNQDSGRPNSSTSSTLLPTHRHRRSPSEQLTQRQLMERLALRRIIDNQESGVQIEVNGSVNQFRQWSQANPQGAASFPDYLRTFIEECRAQKCLLSRDQEQAIIADKLGSEVVQAIKATNERPRNDPDNGFSSAAAMHYPYVRFINPANAQLELHLAGYMDPNHWENIGGCSFKLKEAASPSAAIKAAFQGPTRLDCLPVTELVLAKALLATLGDNLFDRAFAWQSHNDPGIVVGKNTHLLENRIEAYRQYVDVGDLPHVKGDWTYYENDPRYRKKHPASALRGENMICLGNDQFEGFGMRARSLSGVKTLLEDAFNLPPHTRDMDHPDYDDDLVNATDPKVIGLWEQLAIRLDPAKVQALMASSR